VSIRVNSWLISLCGLVSSWRPKFSNILVSPKPRRRRIQTFLYYFQTFHINFRTFSNVFHTFSTAFFLPILPKTYKPTCPPPFLPPKSTSSAIEQKGCRPVIDAAYPHMSPKHPLFNRNPLSCNQFPNFFIKFLCQSRLRCAVKTLTSAF
jgi:hypothetical protein